MDDRENEENFEEFLAALRQGDESAVEELVRVCEPQLRTIARARLAQGNLNRAVDSMDIVQSVVISFLRHVGDGEFSLETRDQIQRLLRTMALNRLRDLARKGGSGGQVRPVSEAEGAGLKLDEIPADASTPSEHVAREDFLAEFLHRLSPESRRIHRLRFAGLSWAEIGDELGAPQNTIRIRFARETLRVARELGLSDESS